MEYPTPAGYEAIEAHIRRAHIQRSVALAQIFAAAADSLGRGVRRLARDVAASFNRTRPALTVEADALLGRNFRRY
jgi:hypothetical protein